MKDNVGNIFMDLIEDGYLWVGQAFMIHWYGLYTFYGKLTADGKLQLASNSSSPIISSSSSSSNIHVPAITEASSNVQSHGDDDNEEDGESFPMVSAITQDNHPHYELASSCLEVQLGEEFRAPSTVTESCYQSMQGMPIVWPRNKEEEQQQFYQLDPKRVRHNGWGKVCFLYKFGRTLTMVTLSANKLRTEAGRARVRCAGLEPIMFDRMTSVFTQFDDLTLAHHRLEKYQTSDQLVHSLQMLHQLRNTGLSSADTIALLVSKLAEAQHCLQQLCGQEQCMESYLQERNEMIGQHLRQTSSDPILLTSMEESTTTTVAPSLPDSLLSHVPTHMSVGVNEILACSGLDFSSSSSSDQPISETSSSTTPPAHQKEEEQKQALTKRTEIWCHVYQVYQQLLESYQQTSLPPPQQQEQTQSIGFYRSVCSYKENDTHANLLSSFYRYIDDCYDGDHERMKQDLLNYVSDLCKQLLDRSPKTLEECGNDVELHWMHAVASSSSENEDPERTAIIQHFLAMSNLVTFVDAALEERSKFVSSTQQQQQQEQDEAIPIVTSPSDDQEEEEEDITIATSDIKDKSDDNNDDGKVLDELSCSYKTTDTYKVQNPNNKDETLKIREMRLVITHLRIENMPVSSKKRFFKKKRMIQYTKNKKQRTAS